MLELSLGLRSTQKRAVHHCGTVNIYDHALTPKINLNLNSTLIKCILSPLRNFFIFPLRYQTTVTSEGGRRLMCVLRGCVHTTNLTVQFKFFCSDHICLSGQFTFIITSDLDETVTFLRNSTHAHVGTLFHESSASLSPPPPPGKTPTCSWDDSWYYSWSNGHAGS